MQRGCLLPTLCLSAVVWFVLSACGCEGVEREVGREGGERERFFGCLTFGGFGLSCGAVLHERGCVLLGVRFSSATRFHGVAFEDCVCSID